jgi:uncharacterized membrane protein
VNLQETPSPTDSGSHRDGFLVDFRRFFVRGLAAILPTLITLWLLLWAWDFLWENIGKHIVFFLRVAWYEAGVRHFMGMQFRSPQEIHLALFEDDFSTRLLGVLLAIVLVYFIGVFVGNLIGHTAWRVAERALLRIPLVRAIYPAVKQVTDFILAERSKQFAGSRVVAVQPHEQGIWSIGLVTNTGEWTLGDRGSETMVTVFVPSTPTSFTGYVLVVPRARVVYLPMKVEEAMRLLISGGVIMPGNPQSDLKERDPGESPLNDTKPPPNIALIGTVPEGGHHPVQ